MYVTRIEDPNNWESIRIFDLALLGKKSFYIITNQLVFLKKKEKSIV